METPVEIAAGAAVEIIIAVLAVGLIYRVWDKVLPVPQRRTVLPFQRGVLIKAERAEKVLEPGSYWITPKRTLLLCDVRPKPFQVPSVELLTADGMGIRMSLGGEYRVAEPGLFLSSSADAFGTFYLELRHALHSAVGELNGHVFLTGQALVTARVKELLLPRSVQLGVELIQLEVYEAVPVGWLRNEPT